ncbi:MAG: bifunctional hydroxymethylpyrimidine kinase/phosphomethylpyrimidine kinase [Spirochaetales bacterium]|nr:bifunctional hydroxymethylpyrimidine kinase/phosphomethylpyrimidine kinase [Spirochaetales bacterium]
MAKNFLTVCLNPALQKTLVFGKFENGAVNRYSEYYLTASGKGINVSRVLMQLGHKVTHLTHAGGNLGKIFTELAMREKIKISAAACKSETRICTTLLDLSAGTTTELVEEAEGVESSCEDRIRKQFTHELDKAHTVIISGSKAPGYSADLYPWMVKTAKAADCAVILDYRGDDLAASLPFMPDIIKPNLDEFNLTLAEHPELDWGGIEITLQHFAEIHFTIPVITNGNSEIIYAADGEIHTAKPEKVKAVNTTGCGDSFTAGLASALYRGQNVHECVKEGIRCAALNAKNRLPGNIG